MALQTSPPISLQDIINEYQPGSFLTPNNLLNFDHMFSGGTPVSILDFLGADQPDGISTGFASNIDAANNEADFSATVTNPGGGAARTDTQCEVAIQYDTTSTFSSPSTTSFQTFLNGGSAVTWTNVDVSDQGTGTIYYRAVAYNSLNNSTSVSVGNTRSFTFCEAPTNFSAVADGFGSIDLSWSSGFDPANGWEIQYSVDGGAYNLEIDGHDGINRSYTHTACNEGNIDNNTQFVTYRIKAQCSGGDSDWVQSNTEDPQCK